jgi:hypothetical protein
MEAASISAFAALAGSAIGGLTSLAASWLSHHVQFTAERRANNRSRRTELYKSFIEEASRLYADAYEHDTADASKLVNLYALISRMRILSSPGVIESADRVARVIIQTYLSPNKTFSNITEVLDNDAMNPLRAFGEACREELQGPDLL